MTAAGETDAPKLESKAAAEQTQSLQYDELDPREERRVVRKLDIAIGIPIFILFLLSFLDRSNLGNALSAGLSEDLNLPSNGSNVATSLLFVTYVLFEAPSAIFFKRFGARKILAFITFAWGTTTCFTGFVDSYGGLIATRLVLGAFESGFFPIAASYLSDWYSRGELGLRSSYLFVAAAFSGAFGGLLAYGILQMDGIGGKRGWQWLYILEGAFTAVVGVLSYFVLADEYEHAWYLTQDDKRVMRLRAERAKLYNGDDECFKSEEIKWALKDPKNWLSGIAQFCADTCLFALATFLPVIIKSLNTKWTTIQAQLLTIPVYVVAAATYVAAAAITDRYGYRAATICTSAILCAVGYAILLATDDLGAKYFATFLAGLIYTTVGLNVSWLNVNNAPSLKRATASGMQLTLGNSGGILAGQIYRKPTGGSSSAYILGYGISLGLLLLAPVIHSVSAAYYVGMNAARDREESAADAGGTVNADEAKADTRRTGAKMRQHANVLSRATGTGIAKDGVERGDRSLRFRYLL